MHRLTPPGTTQRPDPTSRTLVPAESGQRGRPRGETHRLPVAHGPSVPQIRLRTV
jgi:hypothetical protein